jgi:hypothetical protein
MASVLKSGGGGVLKLIEEIRVNLAAFAFSLLSSEVYCFESLK